MKFKRTVLCIESYIEDGIEYWSKGKEYGAIKHHNGNWSIETNKGNVGGIGPAFLEENFEEYFMQVKHDSIKTNQLKQLEEGSI